MNAIVIHFSVDEFKYSTGTKTFPYKADNCFITLPDTAFHRQTGGYIQR